MRLSRSKWDSFIKCPLCFYLKAKHDINPPGQPGHPINSRVDRLLKEEFDRLRIKGEPHPIFKKYNLNFVPYNLEKEVLDTYRNNRKGLEAKSTKTKFVLWLPRRAREYLPDEHVTTEEALERVGAALDRLDRETPCAAHPFLGRLAGCEWIALHLRHAELHMSFVGPVESESTIAP